jgi:hypothetical protein
MHRKKKITVVQLIKTFLAFLGEGRFTAANQEPANGSYPEEAVSRTHHSCLGRFKESVHV